MRMQGADPLVVCAGQRVVQEGSSPSDARMRSVISERGGNASRAGESSEIVDDRGRAQVKSEHLLEVGQQYVGRSKLAFGFHRVEQREQVAALYVLGSDVAEFGKDAPFELRRV